MADVQKNLGVIVSKEAFENDDPYSLVESNITYVNAQLEAYLMPDELPRESLLSYYVDYFLAQMLNGGFSQFVYNSSWGDCIEYVVDGFNAMGAAKHAACFEDAARTMRQDPGIEALKAFLESDYFGENPTRDRLDEFTDDFNVAEASEDLTQLNSAWLRRLPNLLPMSEEEAAAEVRRRAQALPDLEIRVAQALEDEPRPTKLIRALCKEAGHTFDTETAASPAETEQGDAVWEFHFLTDRGHFHMIEHAGKATMFKGHTKDVVCEIEAEPEYGEY